MRRAMIWTGAALVLAMLLGWGMTGCGGRDRPVEVKGLLTLDCVPVENATVRFAPTEGRSTRPSSGITSSDGIFQLTTYSTNDGVLPGHYKVVVFRQKGRVDFETNMFPNMTQENMYKI